MLAFFLWTSAYNATGKHECVIVPYKVLVGSPRVTSCAPRIHTDTWRDRFFPLYRSIHLPVCTLTLSALKLYFQKSHFNSDEPSYKASTWSRRQIFTLTYALAFAVLTLTYIVQMHRVNFHCAQTIFSCLAEGRTNCWLEPQTVTAQLHTHTHTHTQWWIAQIIIIFQC